MLYCRAALWSRPFGLLATRSAALVGGKTHTKGFGWIVMREMSSSDENAFHKFHNELVIARRPYSKQSRAENGPHDPRRDGFSGPARLFRRSGQPAPETVADAPEFSKLGMCLTQVTRVSEL
jgi:hypothetical protein